MLAILPAILTLLAATPGFARVPGGAPACAGIPVGPARALLSPADSLIEARLVFVSFADSPDTTMPVWADSMADELTRFMADMSHGATRLHLQVLRRADDPNAKWRAPLRAIDYASSDGPQWWNANADVLRAIALGRPGVWEGVEHVWVVHDQCAFSCTTPGTPAQCEDTCPWGGIASLGLNASDVPGLRAEGTTQRFLVALPAARQHQVQLSFAAHEFGHRLSLNHSPGSDLGGDAFVNYGRYDLMRSGQYATNSREEGLVPYHPLQLVRLGWLPLRTVSVTTLGVRLPAVLGPRGEVVQVQPPRTTQSFVLAHFDGRTPWDAHYGGNGLHVWHVHRDTRNRDDLAWDLECAGGRSPEALAGQDVLEADPLAVGGPGDAYVPGGRAAFSAITNPTSNLYGGDPPGSPEDVRSGIAIENLRTDPATGDLLVDVYLSPVQRLAPLELGASPGPGDSLGVRWNVRASAQATSVDLDLLTSDGTLHPLAASAPNTGEWHGTLPLGGTGLRIRLVSRDASGATGADTSAAFDALAGLPAAPALRALGANPSADGARWALALPREQAVRLTVYDAAGRPVARLADGRYAAGEHAFAWSGRDARGRAAAAGLYFVRLETPGGSTTRRFVLRP